LIYAQYESGNNTASAAAAADYVKIADVDAVREQLGSRIVAATGVMNSFDRMRIQGGEEDVAIIGSDQYYPQVRNLDLLAGRFFDVSDVNQRHRVAMLMERLARRLFGSQSAAVGQTVKLHGLQFTVIGTFKEKTESFGLSELSGENVLIPITVLRTVAGTARADTADPGISADHAPSTDAAPEAPRQERREPRTWPKVSQEKWEELQWNRRT
jgi:putative ABC transport system permease protein